MWQSHANNVYCSVKSSVSTFFIGTLVCQLLLHLSLQHVLTVHLSVFLMQNPDCYSCTHMMARAQHRRCIASLLHPWTSGWKLLLRSLHMWSRLLHAFRCTGLLLADLLCLLSQQLEHS